jgi:glycosyltransferase involved in cell wall biosynthesis
LSSMPTVSVVIPTLNEALNLRHVFAKLPAGVEVIVVDGRSVDNTIEMAHSLNKDVVVVHQTRKGKGNALACGFAAATGDIIVMLDADGSADPGEIPAFVGGLMAGADFAKGSRSLVGGGSSDITALRSSGNRVLSLLVNTLFKCRYTDLCYGYNAFWRRCLPALGLEAGGPGEPRWGDGFEVETMINIRAAKVGLRIVEIPSYEHDRLHGVSNLNATSDGLRVLRTIFREWWGMRSEPPPARPTQRPHFASLSDIVPKPGTGEPAVRPKSSTPVR